MKKVWIIAPFSSIDVVGVRNRFQYLADRMTREGYVVTLFTSNFSHMKKDYFDISITNQYNYDIKLINEIGYRGNVSLRRVLSHIGFSKNLLATIKHMDKPDLVYAAYPTMSAAYIAGSYCENNNIPFVLDIQDTWPESISSAIDTNKITVKVALKPITVIADRIYRKADSVIGVSDTYALRAKVKNAKSSSYIPVYIGTDLKKFDNVNVCSIEKRLDEVWITYIGTLSYSYDIETAILAISQIKNRNIILNIIGAGPDEKKLVDLSKKLNVFESQVKFYGFIDYAMMVSILKKSDIALNAIKGMAKQTITNKLGDYFAAGLPILNSCKEEEVIQIVTNKNVGINYDSENVQSLLNGIDSMVKNKDIMKLYSVNARKFAEKKFDREESYKAIISEIQNLISEHTVK